jgi:hypothetical protein
MNNRKYLYYFLLTITSSEVFSKRLYEDGDDSSDGNFDLSFIESGFEFLLMVIFCGAAYYFAFNLFGKWRIRKTSGINSEAAGGFWGVIAIVFGYFLVSLFIFYPWLSISKLFEFYLNKDDRYAAVSIIYILLLYIRFK